MRENQRVRLPMGQGLEREAGVMEMRAASFEDLRNVILHDGKAVVRPGFDSPLLLLDDAGNQVSHVCQTHPLLSERVGVVVSYQATTQKVWVHRMDQAGSTSELIGEWVHDQGGWGASPPVVSMAECYGRVFMAHDQRLVTSRAKTIYYDPIFGAQPLNDLENDFTAGGPHKTRFRGVVRHLAYLVGWGYGTATEDRPELVRLSGVGAPTTFDADFYYPAGNPRDAVTCCAPAGKEGIVPLVVAKEGESHVIRGTSRDDMGIFLLDPDFGILASQLACVHGGVLLGWSAEGPRAWDGGRGSSDLAIPLDLLGIEPAGLVAEGDTAYAFAHYVPYLRCVWFVFGRRVYSLSVRFENKWEWSYQELGFEARCALTLQSGVQLLGAPTGFPHYSLWVGGGTYGDMTVVNYGQAGDETLEVWMKPSGGAWALKKSSLVSTSSSQVVRIIGLVPGTVYDVALRYRRGTAYTPGYENSADPSLWPIISRGTATTAIDPPAPVSAVWSRVDAVTEKITLTVTPATGQEAQDIDVFRDGNPTAIGTISGPHSGDAVYEDTGITGETLHSYTFKTMGGSPSINSDPITCWAGPATVPTFAWILGTGPSYEVGLAVYDATLETEVWDDYDDLGSTGPLGLRYTMAAGVTSGYSPSLVNVPSSPGLVIEVQLRHKKTSFTVDDFSQYTTGSQIKSVTIVDPLL